MVQKKISALLDGLDLSFVVSLHSHNQSARVQDAVAVRTPQRAPPVVTPVCGDEDVWVLRGGQRITHGACRGQEAHLRVSDPGDVRPTS